MRDFIETTDIKMQDIVEPRYEVLKIVIDENFQSKVKSIWIEEERKKHIFTSKVKQIITNSLIPNDYEPISNYKTTMKVWDTLEVAHIGTP